MTSDALVVGQYAHAGIEEGPAALPDGMNPESSGLQNHLAPTTSLA